mgnify:CR=1 FL=1
MSIEKRLLELLRDEIKNYGLTSHIRYSLEDESNELNVTVEEFDNFMNGGKNESKNN